MVMKSMTPRDVDDEQQPLVNQLHCVVDLGIPVYKFEWDSKHEAGGFIKLLGVKPSKPSEAVVEQKKIDLEVAL